MTTGSGDAGDWLVTQVVFQLGALTPDEQAAVYGAGYSYASSGTQVPMPADSAAWITTVLRDFRVQPCPFCNHALLEHTLSITEAGPTLICDADGVSRPAWAWHAGPQRPPLWRIALAIILWVGIPLTTIGLAGWLMPTVAALTYRKRRWVLGAVVWGLLTVALVVLIERGVDGPGLGMLALLVWFGSAVYGGFQVKPWLASLPAPRLTRA